MYRVIIVAMVVALSGGAYACAQGAVHDRRELLGVVNDSLRIMKLREVNMEELVVALVNQCYAMKLSGDDMEPRVEEFLADLMDRKKFGVPVEVRLTSGSGWGEKAPSAVFSKDLPEHLTLQVAVLNVSREEGKRKRLKVWWKNILVATALAEDRK